MIPRFHLALPFLCMAVTAGCGDPGQPQPAASLRAALTGPAEAALVDGHLQITPAVPRAQPVPALDSIAAARLADAFLQQFWNAMGTSLREEFEQGHGSRVSLEALQRCGTRFAESPIGPSLTELDYVTRRAFGERWIFRYCLPGRKTAGFVAVSPYATEVVLTDDGIAFPAIAGAEFQAGGLPGTWGEAVRFTPEKASLLAFACTGKRVREVPRLVLEYRGDAPLAKWLLVLESLANIITPHGFVAVDTVFVGYSVLGDGTAARYHVGITMASPHQPGTVRLQTITNLPPPNGPIPPGWEAEFHAFTAQREPSIPVEFDSIPCAQSFEP